MDDGIFEFGIQKVQELVAIQGLDFVENWMQDPFRNMRWCFVWLHLTSFMYLLAFRSLQCYDDSMALAKANGWLSATNRTKRSGVGMSWDLGRRWEYRYMVGFW